MLQGNLMTWSKYRWNIERRILRKLMSLILYMKKLRNLRACAGKAWLM